MLIYTVYEWNAEGDFPLAHFSTLEKAEAWKAKRCDEFASEGKGFYIEDDLLDPN